MVTLVNHGMQLSTYCETTLEALDSRNLRRTLHVSHHRDAVEVVHDEKKYINFASNDYLGLRAHPAVIAAARDALDRYGAGAGASRLITGNHPLYHLLEQKLARMKHAEAALVFGSGYLANLGIIPALMGKGDVIFADKLVHACIVDAAQLSGARLLRFAHNDMGHLARLLKAHRDESSHALIVTDHVFSMDGDVAPLAEIAALANMHDAWTMVDDAHGLGIVAADRQPIDLWMGTFSKAAGSYGGYVLAKQAVIDYLITAARSFIFTTGLPPSVCAASLAALEIIEAEPERGARAIALARRFTSALGLPAAQSAIVPLMVETPERAIGLAQALKEKGLLALAIRPPTVPVGTSRLRIAFSYNHTDAQVEQLINALKDLA
jgi:8-amino-7-oxononanoate synthase